MIGLRGSWDGTQPSDWREADVPENMETNAKQGVWETRRPGCRPRVSQEQLWVNGGAVQWPGTLGAGRREVSRVICLAPRFLKGPSCGVQ